MATFELSSVKVQDAKGKDRDFPIPETWSSAFVQYMIEYAWGVRFQRSTASAKDADKAKMAVVEDMEHGRIPTRGATGSRLDNDDEADHQWLAEIGFKGNKKDLDERWKSLVRAKLVAKYPELKGTDKRDELEAKVTELLPTVQENARKLEDWTEIRARLDKKEKSISADALGI
jgi:hypothetical protein